MTSHLPQIASHSLQMTLQLRETTLQLREMTLSLRQVTLHPSQMTLHRWEVPLALSQMTSYLSQVPSRLRQMTLPLREVILQLPQMTSHVPQMTLQLREITLHLWESDELDVGRRATRVAYVRKWHSAAATRCQGRAEVAGIPAVSRRLIPKRPARDAELGVSFQGTPQIRPCLIALQECGVRTKHLARFPLIFLQQFNTVSP
jgi:hypothetical protein